MARIRRCGPAGGTRSYTSAELEAGGEAFAGALGDGSGKWHLKVSSDHAVRVLSLLASPAGHLTNLSTVNRRGVSTRLLWVHFDAPPPGDYVSFAFHSDWPWVIGLDSGRAEIIDGGTLISLPGDLPRSSMPTMLTSAATSPAFTSRRRLSCPVFAPGVENRHALLRVLSRRQRS